MVQVISRRHLAAEDRVRFLVCPCDVCGGQSATGTGFLRDLRFFPGNIILPWLSTLSYHLRMNDRPVRGRSLET
jgi:hypothetical protein